MKRNVQREAIAGRTFLDYGQERLGGLCDAIGLGAQAGAATSMFGRLLDPWGDRRIGAEPAWRSDIVDDHTPYEFSIAMGGRRQEVRILIEAQGETPTLRAQQEAGRQLTRRLEAEFGADLGRLRRIEDLFLPEDPKGIFSVWHAVSFRSDMQLDLKIYLNLQARGRALAPALTEEAMGRLGFGHAWPAFSRIAARRGFELDELIYLSLDLTPRDNEARVKFYFRHHRPTAAELDAALSLSMRHEPGHIVPMCRALGGSEGPFSTRAPVSCFSYVEGDVERPSESTFYFPVGGYVTDDREATSRVSAYLGQIGVSSSAYEAAVDALATRPLEDGVGMQSYLSLRHDHGRPRLTVYFGPEAYSVQPPRARSQAAAAAPRAEACFA